MRAKLQMDIGASHLRLSIQPSTPTWAHRVLHALHHRSHGLGPPSTNLADTDDIDHSRAQLQPAEETVAFSAAGAGEDPADAIMNAGTQALQALRASCPSVRDGCSLNVRVGMSLTSLSMVPLNLSAASRRSDRQLQQVAQAVVQEALGADTRAWQARWQVQADAEHLCVAALESSFIAKLQALCDTQNLRFSSCQPALTERLDRELAASATSRDSRTLVWTELDAVGRRHAVVNFVRVVNGSGVNAWRALVPSSPEKEGADQLLQASIDRFLIAAGASQDERLVLCQWPGLLPESPSLAVKEFLA